MHRECRERFSRHWLQKKPLVSNPDMHHGTCVTHVPWCMSGSLTRRGRENVPGNPGACATRNFTYLARGPWTKCVCFAACFIKVTICLAREHFVDHIAMYVENHGYMNLHRVANCSMVHPTIEKDIFRIKLYMGAVVSETLYQTFFENLCMLTRRTKLYNARAVCWNQTICVSRKYLINISNIGSHLSSGNQVLHQYYGSGVCNFNSVFLSGGNNVYVTVNGSGFCHKSKW